MIERCAAVLVLVFALALVPLPASRAQVPDVMRDVAVVVRLDSRALFDADGTPARSASESVATLAQQLRELTTGALRRIPLALAVSPVMCDEIRLLGTNSARRVLATIRALARTHPVLWSAYSDASFSGEARSDVVRAVRSGRDALEGCTRVKPREPFAPPGLTLPSTDLIAEVHTSGVRAALSAFAVPPAGARPKIVPAVRHSDIASIDDLATVRPEARTVTLVAEGRGALRALRALASDERFRIRSINSVADQDVVGGLIDTRQGIGADARRALSRAEALVTRFRSLVLPDNRLASVYETSLARAHEAATHDRRDATAPLMRAISHELGKVSVSDGSVTFTSSRGSVPVTVSNTAPYPVRVRVTVSSTKLRFSPRPWRDVTVRAPGETITFEARARSSGTFPMFVAIMTPGEERPLDRAELTVRSAAVNLPAVVLTGGGAIFLLVWFVRRIRRRTART